MKTYYDLISKERDKYMDEFKNTPVGKDLFKTRAILIVLTSIILVGVMVLGIYLEETNSVINNLEKMENFAGFMLIFNIIYSVYFNINFTSWLKNKHNIKKW